jgi:hypothetical protein
VGMRDKLRNIVDYVRTRWRSINPDSYHQYRAERERERKRAEQTLERAEQADEREREGAEREREYEERYRGERAAEEPRTEVPRGDTSQPE